MHDIGKIGISEHLLNKKNSLTKEERNIIQMHPQLGEKIIAHIEPFQQYRSIIRSHHERLDGSGYPDGLKNDQISTEVRIISIADAFDAMTSDRAYRKALPVELAVEQLKMCSGIQFDADLVDVFIENELYML